MAADAERFWARVDRSGGLAACWEWRGARDSRAYGRISKRSYGESLAHRYAWSRAHGRAPGEAVMHECDNPSCCNPLHLTDGTRLLNNRQAWQRGLHPQGELHCDARLSDAEVAAIRARVASGESQRTVAAVYGVTPSHVSRIVNHLVRKAA